MQSLHDQSPAVSPEPAALQAIRYRPVAEVSPWLALPESLKALPEMAFCASPDGRLCAYNDQWLVGTGMHNAAGMWNDWTQAAHEEDRPALWALWFASLADGRALEETLRLRRADGRFGWVTARARAVRDTDGAVSYWLGTAVDIDAIKVSAEQAKMVAEEMAHRNGNLLAVVTSMLVLSARERPEAAEFARSTRSR